jgi:hypothetical protein
MEIDFDFLRAAHFSFFQMYTSEQIDQMYVEKKKVKSLVLTLCVYLWRFIESIVLIPCANLTPALVKNKIIFFHISNNNYLSLEPVFAQLKSEGAMLTVNTRLRDKGNFVSLWRAYVNSFLKIPQFLSYYHRATSDDRKVMFAFMDHILLSLGYLSFVAWYLERYLPKAIVIANDHVFFTRILVEMAKKKNIPTFFIQHASAYDGVPKIFVDLALLEGQHAKEKYLEKGSNSQRIKLVGIPKFDPYFGKINENHQIQRLGFCTNRSMDFQETKETLTYIRQEFPNLKIILRPHPTAEPSGKYAQIIQQLGLAYSNANKEPAFLFLQDVDVVISGNSSILLEAAILNVVPIYIFSDNTKRFYSHDRFDKYDYVKHKVAYPINNHQELLRILTSFSQTKPDVRENVKIYCDTIATSYDGKSAVLAKEIITKTIEAFQELAG